MPLLVLASATDIANWATSRSAQERLPELIRRLVLATSAAPEYVDFPAGDAIQLPGADGIVEMSEVHAVVPQGVSVWEMGADANPKRKADDDYEKRTADPPASARGQIVPAESTFLFVTPRRWSSKDEWSAIRRAEKKWKDVRVLDADDLESWAQQAPATHVWLSRILGKVGSGVDDIETVWSDWTESVAPTANAALVLAGRESEAAELAKWLGSSNASSLTVAAESTVDALGFIAATIMVQDESERLSMLARTVVVSDKDSFNQLAGSTSKLVMVPVFPAGMEVQRAVRGGHQVAIPGVLLPAGKTQAAQLIVPRVQRKAAETALIAMGVPELRARDLAGIARRSMLTLRRRLSRFPSLQMPAWANPTTGPSLVPMLLLGQFNESRDADLQLFRDLAGQDLAVLRELLNRWANEVDPPLRHVGNTWYLVSKEDAWALLSRFVTTDALERFRRAVTDVLLEVHPKFDLPAEHRWAASLHGKENQYSSTVVAGISDTIALLGALSGSFTIQGGVAPAAFANRLVRELFDAVSDDWQGWATLSPVLPALAEGAPEAFLQAVDTQIAGNKSVVSTLFGDDGDVLFSSSPHTGLLWALEVLAWSPDHLSHAARILAKLDRLDPGGRLLNRPLNSLRSIFLSWLPQTGADLETRLNVLDELRRQEPVSSWRLFVSLLPKLHDHSGHNPRPKWRDWETSTHATYGQMAQQTSTIVAWMIEDAGVDPKRWLTLVEAIDKLGPEAFSSVISGLRTFLGSTKDEDARTVVNDGLREMLSKHRSFSDADWALKPEFVKEIDALFQESKPREPFARVRWLFSERPQLPDGREQDWEEHSKAVWNEKLRAIRELYDAFGVEGIIERADQVGRPDEFGRALATVDSLSREEEDRLLERLLSTSDPSKLQFAHGFAHGWTVRVGPEIAARRVSVNDGHWSDETRGRLLLSQMANASTLDIVDVLNPSGKAAYWSAVYPFWLDGQVVERGLQGLLEHNRPHALVDSAAALVRRHKGLDPHLLATALERVATTAADKNGQRVDAHDVGEILDALERAVDENRFEDSSLAKLELLYLPMLDRHTRPARALHKVLRSDPHFFVDAIVATFRAQHEHPKDLTPEEAMRAQYAYRLIDTWRIPPGQQSTGFDEAFMNSWVDRARQELKALNRLEIGDQVIGQVMSGSGSDSDGAWPLIPIRDLVERLASEDFEVGLQIGRFNSKGVTIRNPLSGGDIERAEASAYERMAAITATRWFRTSEMLKRMAESAIAHAVREDIESELREDLFD